MSIKYDKLSRRMFLQGMSATGGYLALGIPLLPSLLPSRAQAQATVIPPRFIAMSSQNGCPRSEDWFPANRPTNPLYMFPALGTGYYSSKEHYAHNGPITTTSSGISTLFDSKFNPYAGKMTFLRGLDYPYTPDGNHDGGPLLGNIRASTGNLATVCNPYPTIDQIMAYSDGFYPNNGVGYVRSVNLNISNRAGLAWGFSNPIARTGDIVHLPSIFDPRVLFTTLFGAPVDPGAPSVTPYVDSVMAGFKRVMNGRAISSDDKQLLQSHIDLFADLEKNLGAPPVTMANCGSLTAPSSRTAINLSHPEVEIKKSFQLMNDMIVLALKCQRTRVVTNYIQTIPGYEGGGGSGFEQSKWHWASHTEGGALDQPDTITGRQMIRDIYKWISDNVLYDLVTKLDSVVEANGKTILDNSLVQYSAAAMDGAHSHDNMPVLLFGSAGGKIKTGQYCDYQNRLHNPTQMNQQGVLFNQYLVTAMQAVGLTPKHYSMTDLNLLYGRYPVGHPGYADSYMQIDQYQTGKVRYRYEGQRQAQGNWLPFV